MTGYIKFFDVRRRFGYIVPNGVSRNDADKHVFFYEDTLSGGQPVSGEIVEFALNPHYPNPCYPTRRALTVQLLSKPSAVPINRKAVANGD